MPGGYKNINGNDGKQFSSEYQPSNPGRKPSFKTQFKSLFKEENRGVKEYLQEDVEFFIHTEPDGTEVEKVRVQMGTMEAIALNVLDIAMKGRPKDVLDAAKFIASQIDGDVPLVAIQNNIQNNIQVNYDLSKLDDKELIQFNEFLKRVSINSK